MKTLFFFEMKKIWQNKLVWAGLALFLLLFCGGLSSFLAVNVPFGRELAARYEGPLTDETVARMLADFKPTQAQLDLWKTGVNHISINNMQSAVHLRFANSDGSWNGKTVRDVFGDQTIQVDYTSGWLCISRVLVRITVGLSLLAVLIASTAFAGEYGGPESILLTAKRGRGMAVRAKLAAVFTSVFSLAALALAIPLGLAFSRMGTDGLDASTLFCEMEYQYYTSRNLTCGSLLAWQCALILSGLFLLTAAVLAISAVSRNALTAIVCAALFLFAPLLPSVSERSPLFRLLGLFPIQQFQFSSLISVMLTDRIPYAALVLPLSALLGLAALFTARRQFALHQVL